MTDTKQDTPKQPSFAEQWRAQAVKRHEIRDAKGFAAKWFHAGEKFAKGQK